MESCIKLAVMILSRTPFEPSFTDFIMSPGISLVFVCFFNNYLVTGDLTDNSMSVSMAMFELYFNSSVVFVCLQIILLLGIICLL